MSDSVRFNIYFRLCICNLFRAIFHWPTLSFFLQNAVSYYHDSASLSFFCSVIFRLSLGTFIERAQNTCMQLSHFGRITFPTFRCSLFRESVFAGTLFARSVNHRTERERVTSHSEGNIICVKKVGRNRYYSIR